MSNHDQLDEVFDPVSTRDTVATIFDAIPNQYWDDLRRPASASSAHSTAPTVQRNGAQVCSSPDGKTTFRVEPQIDHVRSTRAMVDPLLFALDGMYMVQLQEGVYLTADSLRIAADYLDQLNKPWREHVVRALDGADVGMFRGDIFT